MRLLFILLLVCSTVIANAQVRVRGYYRKNGTYVQPHQRTRRNSRVTDNYSYPGNYNPNEKRTTGGSTRKRSPAVQSITEHKSYEAVPEPIVEPELPEENSEVCSAADETTSGVTTGAAQLYAQAEPNAALKIKPNYAANSTYAIPKGAIVKIIKYNENYYLAEVNGRSGYVCTCQVTKTFSK